MAVIDTFMDFAGQARGKTEKMLEEMGRTQSTSSVDSDLLVQMVKEIGALRVGKFYRERVLTGHYAEVLLDSYMFPRSPDAKDRRNQVISKFLFGAPAHNFHLDYQMCRGWHLNVDRMPTPESDLTGKVIEYLDLMTDKGLVCPKLNRNWRMPFIRFYDLPTNKQGKTGGRNAGRGTTKRSSK